MKINLHQFCEASERSNLLFIEYCRNGKYAEKTAGGKLNGGGKIEESQKKHENLQQTQELIT